MSTKDKLLAMTVGLQVPADKPHDNTAMPPAAPIPGAERMSATRFPPVVPGSAPRTGPGQTLQFRGQMLAIEAELGQARERLKEHDGASPTRKLDPTTVVASQWANRHPDSFANADFARLKQDIEQAGGNVQAISVRPLIGQLGRYELIFGHRRHRACLELGLPVLATIDASSLSDLEMFSAMDRENRERANLSPYEQGTMYRRALDEKLYPSNRRLAEALGVSHTWVANVLQVADLPPAILECFQTPIEVQHRHAKELSTALEQDRKAVLKRAEKLKQQPRKLAPAAVVHALVKPVDDAPPPKPQPIEAHGKRLGKWFHDSAGRLVLQIDPGVVEDDDVDDVVRKLAQLLGG